MGAPDRRVVLLDELTWEDSEGSLEFRLTYEGLLLASNTGTEKTARKEYKRAVRRKFHGQLKRLWEITPFLKAGGQQIKTFIFGALDHRPKYSIDHLAKKHSHYGFNFVPLVTSDLWLSCWLDILFLRRQPSGELFRHGDIDNRLKTLFDCLQIPDAHQGYESIKPDDSEKPFFCLLENDKMISKISVETDLLLEEIKPEPIIKPTEEPDSNDARLVITVKVRPNNINQYNVQFV